MAARKLEIVYFDDKLCKRGEIYSKTLSILQYIEEKLIRLLSSC